MREWNIKNKNFKQSAHLTYSCQYHVIFCPKYRRKILKDGVDIILKQIFYDIATQYNFEIIELEIMADHIHLLIDCNPRFGIMNCVKKLKGISSNKLKKYSNLQINSSNIWTRGTFISTVGSVSLKTVKKYIETQKLK